MESTEDQEQGLVHNEKVLNEILEKSIRNKFKYLIDLFKFTSDPPIFMRIKRVPHKIYLVFNLCPELLTIVYPNKQFSGLMPDVKQFYKSKQSRVIHIAGNIKNYTIGWLDNCSKILSTCFFSITEKVTLGEFIISGRCFKKTLICCSHVQTINFLRCEIVNSDVSLPEAVKFKIQNFNFKNSNYRIFRRNVKPISIDQICKMISTCSLKKSLQEVNIRDNSFKNSELKEAIINNSLASIMFKQEGSNHEYNCFIDEYGNFNEQKFSLNILEKAHKY
ncbi:unnamed protein product [Moneuplotes crassus]|uniref:Uncharacterized protein n=1 Tax=Euplotes crassus TaxID=5936 RepID=A0AAD1XMP8_EUPCR|nr:unnamed protein product [Moneuplotes crassus]